MQTPTAGISADFSMDVATVLTAIETYLRELKISRGAKTVDVATLGDTHEAPWATLKNGTLSGGGVWTPTIDGYFDGALGLNTTSFRLRPGGAGTGLVEYTGEMVVTQYDPFAATVDGVDMFTFTAQIYGAPVRTVQA